MKTGAELKQWFMKSPTYNPAAIPESELAGIEMKNTEGQNTTITVECKKCGWITDMETTSETNPTHCPKCGGELVNAYTGEPY